MDNDPLTRLEKYSISEQRLKLGHTLPEIAKHFNMTLNSLYVLRSDIKKTLDTKVDMISFENLKDHLARYPERERNTYLLNEITRPGKPLRSNTLLIIGAIRDMLRSKRNG